MMRRVLSDCLQLRPPQQCLSECRGQCARRFARSPRALQLCLNSCDGLSAQMSTDRALRNRRHQVRSELPLPGGRRLDRRVRLASGGVAHHEEKHIDLARYLLPGGQLNEPQLRERLRQIIAQINRYQAALPSQAARVRLVVRVPSTTPRPQAISLQRFLLGELAPRNIAVTVIMPGSRAANAFLA